MDEQKETSKIEASEIANDFKLYMKALIEHYTKNDEINPEIMKEIRKSVQLIMNDEIFNATIRGLNENKAANPLLMWDDTTHKPNGMPWMK